MNIAELIIALNKLVESGVSPETPVGRLEYSYEESSTYHEEIEEVVEDSGYVVLL